MDCSLLGSFVHGILQARILKCVATPFSRESSQSRDWSPPISCIAGGFFNLWATGEALTGVKASIKGCYIQQHVEKHSVGTKWIGQFDRRRQWHPTLVLLPGKFHGWRRLVGCSTWGHRESNMTEWLHFHALEKEMATHSSVLVWRIPGRGSLVGCRLWSRTESDMTEVTSHQQQPQPVWGGQGKRFWKFKLLLD